MTSTRTPDRQAQRASLGAVRYHAETIDLALSLGRIPTVAAGRNLLSATTQARRDGCSPEAIALAVEARLRP